MTRTLAAPGDFLDVPADDPAHWRRTAGLFRDTPEDGRCAFVVRDRHYVSARWPGDVHAFARRFAQVLEEARAGPTPL